MSDYNEAKTISYYLSKDGIANFKIWYNSVDLLKPIINSLNNYIYVIENSTWLDDNLRKECFDKIRNLIIKHIETIINKDPDIYFKDWIESIQQYCFQGGFGHRIKYSGDCPHHWCVKIENYEKVKNIPDIIKLYCIASDKYIIINPTPEQIYWN